MKLGTKKMVTMAVLSALAIVLMMVTKIPVFPVGAPYLIYESADVPILVGAFLFGPLEGLVITFAVSAIQATLFSADGWVGFIMHMAASGAFVLTAGFIYKRFHSFKGAVAALLAGTIARVLIMIPVNFVIQPNFYNVPFEAVKAAMIPFIIPFNLLIAGVNSFLTMIVYKAISRAVRTMNIK